MTGGSEYDLANFTDDAEYVLRDDAGDVLLFEDGERERVEVLCDRCGRWTSDVQQGHGGWTCTHPCTEPPISGRH